MSTSEIEGDDIHNFERRYENALRLLNSSSDVCPANRTKILEFLTHCKAKELRKARQLFYLQRLTTIASLFKTRKFTEATKQDVEQVFASLGERKGRNGKHLNAWTTWGYKVAAKVFWRWLRSCGEGEDPPETAWIKTTMAKSSKILPDDLLDKKEVLAILRAATHPMHKALVTTGHEAGCRPNEWLTIRIKDVSFDEYGAVIMVRGKNGSRRVRLVLAAPALRQWLEIHPYHDDPAWPLWICLQGEHAGRSLGYDRARKLVQTLARQAVLELPGGKRQIGIRKRINLYKFRHSTITSLAGELTEAQLCEVFGWVQGSRMPQIYVHLNGRDVDQTILKLHGVIKANEVEKKTLERQVCGRCGTENPPEGRFCTTCAGPLDAKTALELEGQRHAADEIMNTLIRDPEVQALLMRKLVELGLAEKLTASQTFGPARREPAPTAAAAPRSPCPPTAPTGLRRADKKPGVGKRPVFSVTAATTQASPRRS
jgi:integrase/recombinase XerD